MTYANSTSFRRALEDRLRSQSLQTGVPLARLRKMDYTTLPDAVDAARRFVDPVLKNKATGTWDPVTWSWHPPWTP